MYKLVLYGLNEASSTLVPASIPGDSGIQEIKTSKLCISSTTRACGVCDRSWVRECVSVEYVCIAL